MDDQNPKLSELIHQIRKRAMKSKVFAQISVFVIIFTVALMIAFFVSVKPYFSISFSETPSFKIAEDSLGKGEAPAVEAIKDLENQVKSLRKQVQSASGLQESILYSISASITRIASIFLAVYLIQILVGFTRYYFRLSDHLEATADSLELSGGDLKLVDPLLKSISPHHIEFGKMPKTPIEQTTELIQELVKKIPTK